MKTSFFRWAIGLGVTFGAPLVMATERVAADADRFVSLALWARDDIAPDITVAVRDSSSHDITATCQRGAAVSPDIDGWQCTSSSALLVDVSTGPGVSTDIICTGPGAASLHSSNGQLVLPPAMGNTNCLIRATPPASAPPTVPFALGVMTPVGQADLRLTLYDADGNERVGECTATNSSLSCTPLPYGTYHFGVRSGSPMARFVVGCFVYSTADGGGALGEIDSITFGPETLAASCSAVAAGPHVSVNGTTQPVRLVADDGTTTACTVSDDVNWACNPPTVGHYRIELAEATAQLPTSCAPMFALPAIDPVGFAVTGEGIEWYTCDVLGGAPPTPTTIGGPTDSAAPSDTTGSEAPTPTTAPNTLPATGGAAPLLPAALAVVTVGIVASLLARRPVR